MSALHEARDWLWRTFAYASWVRETERRETEAAEQAEQQRQLQEAEDRAAYEPAVEAVLRADEQAEREKQKAAEHLAWHEARVREEKERMDKLQAEVDDLLAFALPGTRFVYLGLEMVALGVAQHTGEAVLVAEHVVDGCIVEARFGWDHLPALRSERWRAQAESLASSTFSDLPADWHEPHD